MIARRAVALGLLAAASAVQGEFVERCLTSNTLTTPEKVPLELCKEYSERSCCTEKEDASLLQDFETAYNAIFGTCPGCRENYRRMVCGLYCSPTQAKYVSNIKRNKKDEISDGTFRLCPEFCNYLYNSCSNTTKINEYRAGQTSFCESTMDTNRHIKMTLNHYDCFGANQAPGVANQCDGSFFVEPRPVQVGNAGLIIGVVLVVVAAMAGIGFTVSKYMALTKGGDEEEGAGAGEEEGETLIGQDSLEPGGSAAK